MAAIAVSTAPRVRVIARSEESRARLARAVEQAGIPLVGGEARHGLRCTRLDGHTDARGTEAYNATLSTARAEAVRDALIRGGMPAERVIVTAAGESASTAPEQDTDGMALERRVNMSVVDVDTGRVAGTN